MLCFFIGSGLLGLAMLAIYRFRGAPYSGEGIVLVASFVSIAMGAGVPLVRFLAEWIHSD
jgi:hypothetical protein